MKKIIIPVILFIFITGISLASVESGKKYLVKKGNSIYQIATKIFHIPWGDVRSEMRKKDTIHPGQQFTLSDLLDLTKEKIWKNFNVKPFKKFQASSQKQLKRDRKGLEILGLSKKEIDEVMEKHIKALRGGQEGFRYDVISNEDEFAKVLFGDFYIWHNVKTNYGNDYQPAWVYKTSSGIEVWYPRTCGNWALTKKKAKKVFALRPPPVPPMLPPPLIRKASIQRILFAHYRKYRWDWDSTWGGFDENYRDGNHVRGWWQSSTLYPSVSDDNDGNQWSFGLNYTKRQWKGATGEADPYHYEGDVDIWALAGRFRDTERKWEVLARAGIGQRKDTGYLVNKWGRYDAKQNVNLFNFYTSAENNSRYNKMFFPKVRGSAEIELAYNQEKQAFWTDQWDGRQPRDGQPDDKSTYSGALYADILNLYKKDFQIWGEARTTYYPEGYKWGNGIRCGLNLLNDSFKIGIGYTLWNDPNADSTGYYAETNLYNLYHRIFGYDDDSADERFQKIKQKEKESEILELLGGKQQKQKIFSQGEKEDEIVQLLIKDVKI